MNPERSNPARRKAIKCILKNIQRNKDVESRRRQLNAMGMPMADNKPVPSSTKKKQMSTSKKLGKTNESTKKEKPIDRSVETIDDTPSHEKPAKRRKIQTAVPPSTDVVLLEKKINEPRCNEQCVDLVSVFWPPVEPLVKLDDGDCQQSGLTDAITALGLGVDNNEKHPVVTLLTNLKNSTLKLPIPNILGSKTKPFKTSRMGIDLLRACLRAPLCALASRANVTDGVCRWKKAAVQFETAICADKHDVANGALLTVSNWLLDSTLAERCHYERLANLCHEMFDAKVLPNKYFNEAYITTDHTDPLVRTASFLDYRNRVLIPVWRRLRETTMSFVVGPGAAPIGMDAVTTIGGSRSNGHIFQACVANVIQRGKEAKDTMEEIKKGVSAATTAGQLVSAPIAYMTPAMRKALNPTNINPAIPVPYMWGGGYPIPFGAQWVYSGTQPQAAASQAPAQASTEERGGPSSSSQREVPRGFTPQSPTTFVEDDLNETLPFGTRPRASTEERGGQNAHSSSPQHEAPRTPGRGLNFGFTPQAQITFVEDDLNETLPFGTRPRASTEERGGQNAHSSSPQHEAPRTPGRDFNLESFDPRPSTSRAHDLNETRDPSMDNYDLEPYMWDFPMGSR